MKTRPILFGGKMVRAITDGRKTQTRRVIRPQPEQMYWAGRDRYLWRPKRGMFVDAWAEKQLAQKMAEHCPHGAPGDRLWLKETWCPLGDIEAHARAGEPVDIAYKADWDADGVDREEARDAGVDRWRPSRFMPRWASRITLEVVSRRAERVQDISNADVIAEGIGRWTFAVGAWADDPPDPRWKFIELWDSLNAKASNSFESNPWIWVVEFRRVEELEGDHQ